MNFHLKIVASERTFFEGDCESLVLNTNMGKYGVLAKHESMVVGMEPGQIRYRVNGTWTEAVNGIGFASIHDNTVVVLVDTVELPEEIDYNRAMEAKRRAEEAIQQKHSIAEYYQGKMALARSMARINAKK